jgi:hypothetical protein
MKKIHILDNFFKITYCKHFKNVLLYLKRNNNDVVLHIQSACFYASLDMLQRHFFILKS